jgi:CBS domain-containing protein
VRFAHKKGKLMKTQNKLTDIQIKEVMSSRVQSLMTEDTIHDAVAMMLDNGLSTVPVVDDENKCIGILSRSDMTELFLEEHNELSNVRDVPRMSLEWLSQSLDSNDVRLVKELMTYEVATINASQTLQEASQAMVRQKIHHLPVIDEKEQITGIVSAFDIVKAVAEAE